MDEPGFRLLAPAEVAGFACRSRALERLLAYWCRQRGARTMPRRGDIDPADIVELLPHIMMVEMVGAPPRPRYRLVGTAIVEFAQFDFTNQFADELMFQDTAGTDWAGDYHRVAAARTPGFGVSRWLPANSTPHWIEYLICPLSRDGETVGRFISIEDYEPLTAIEREALPAVHKH
jgi:hypothetical protein